MRLIMVAVGFALSVAMLVGCSSSTQPAASLPSSASVANSRAVYLQLLKEQIDGKLPHYLPRKILETQYKEALKSAPLPQVQRGAGAVAAWVVDQPYEYLFGLTRKGKVVRAISLASSFEPCIPSTVKVDHSRNVWVMCQLRAYLNGGKYVELDPSGTLTNTYAWQPPTVQCPPSAISCQTSGGGANDGIADGSHVFAGITMTTVYCVYVGSQQQCNSFVTPGFLWWPQGNPSATPTFINLQNCCGSTPIGGIGYLDVDSSGDILFDYSGGSTSCSQSGLGEIKNPTSPSWSFVSLIPCSASGPVRGPAGVYVGHNGSTSTLNITDVSTNLIYQWVLPFNPSGSYTTLGPTRKNIEGQGTPISGGFDLGDTQMVQGDAAGWVDWGQVVKNKWRIVLNADILGVGPGAALTPSDK